MYQGVCTCVHTRVCVYPGVCVSRVWVCGCVSGCVRVGGCVSRVCACVCVHPGEGKTDKISKIPVIVEAGGLFSLL